MMKFKIVKSTLLIVCMAAFSGSSFAALNAASKSAAVTYETDSFADVIATTSRIDKKYGSENVLIVLDIDNTILTSDVDLGGDIWYQWQRGKLEIKPAQEDKVRCLFNDSIGLLYELGTMTLTEKSLPEEIAKWQSAGNTVLALTSRAPKYRSATERELSREKINFDAAALAPKGEKAPVYREKLGKRELSYMQGIMMTSGMDKGKMLDYIMKKTDRHFDAIIFVDDSLKNVKAMYSEFSQHKNIETIIYHYTKIEEARKNKNGTVLTKQQALKMASDWKKLNATLNEIFPGRNISQGCLDLN